MSAPGTALNERLRCVMWWNSKRDVENRMLREQLEESRATADYWRDKAEKLLDAALLRKGEVGTLIFGKPDKRQSPFGNVLAALNVHEIDLAKPPGTMK